MNIMAFNNNNNEHYSKECSIYYTSNKLKDEEITYQCSIIASVPCINNTNTKNELYILHIS